MEPKFYMMIGLPGSGKSYVAENLAKKENATIISSDSIRKELFGDENIQGDPSKVFNIVKSRVIRRLSLGQNCILDATNISYKRRMGFLNSLKKIECKKKCVLVWAPYEVCLQRNGARERKVPEYVIKRMYKNFDVPYYYEGWDTINVIYNCDSDGSFYSKFFKPVIDFNQDNTHHTLSLDEHLYKASQYEKIRLNFLLKTTAFIHDCGKIFTKTYERPGKEPDGQAHYYGHQNVGAYDALYLNINNSNLLLDSEDVLYIAILIRWHMEPYFYENNFCLKDKRKALWGEKLFNDIELLHEADVVAHQKGDLCIRMIKKF